MTDSDFEYTDEELVNPDLKCSICTNPFEDPYCTPCNHRYCQQCITQWLRDQNKCPICRRSIKLTDLVRDETTISLAINRLFVRCTRCGQSSLYRGDISNHIDNDCPGILLYTSRSETQASSSRSNNVDSDHLVMSRLESLINPNIRLTHQLKKEQQRQKTVINDHDTQINILTKLIQDTLNEQQDEIKIIRQSNIIYQAQIEQLEHQVQKLINEQNISIKQLQNYIKHFNNSFVEHESAICNLEEKVDRLVPHENPLLENCITEGCPFGSELVLCNENLTDRDVEIIVKKAIINRQCTSLDLSENEITSHAASIIADTFQLNINLKKLNLSSNDIFDEGVQFLAEGLLANLTLTELNLGSTGITNQGIIHLKEMLLFNKTLKKLYLYKNNIGDNGLKLLTDVLSEHNQTLKILSLHSNRSITNASVPSIIDMFRQNQSIEHIDIHQCDFTRETTTRLCDAAINASIDIRV